MAYSDEVLADSPSAYWRMEETSGTDFVDEVASLELSIFGADPNVSGPDNLGSACFLDGVDDTLEEQFILGNTGDIATLEFWFRAGLTNQPSWARMTNGTGSDGGMLVQRHSSNDALRFTVSTSAGSTQLDTTGFSPFDDTWHHVVATADGTDMKLYVDTVERLNSPYDHGGGVTFRDVFVAVSDQYLGYIDELALYEGVALSLTRIEAHFDAVTGATFPAAPTNLTATAVSATQVDLSWDAVSGATGYDVRRGGLVIATDVGVTTYSDTSPDGSTLYEVRAVDS